MPSHPKSLHILAVLIVLAGAAGPAVPSFSAAGGHLQPLLAQLAARAPRATVAVIVQKTGASQAAEQLATQLGGRITTGLPMIHAFAAQMPAGALEALAASPAVRWVSLDA